MILMIVDDEPQILEGLSEIVRRQCPFVHKIICAQDGIDALDILERDGIGELDLVVSDIYLPEMNGFELISAISDRGITSRFIIISGYDDFRLAREAIKNKVIDYLVKPINAKELVALLTRVHDDMLRSSEARRRNELDRFIDTLRYRVDYEDMFIMEPYLYDMLPGRRFTFLLARTAGAEAGEAVAKQLKRFITAPYPRLLFTMPQSGDVVVILNSDEPIEQSLLDRYDAQIRPMADDGLVLGTVTHEAVAAYDQLSRHLQTALSALVYRQDLGAQACAPADDPLESLGDDFPQYDLTALEAGQALPRLKLEKTVERYLDSLPAALLADPAGLRGILLRNISALRAAQLQNGPTGAAEASNDSATADVAGRDALARLLADALEDYSRGFAQAMSRTPSSSIREIKDYIEEHYAEQIRLDQVARLVYKHPNYVSARFRQEMGMTFIQYLHHIRIEKAKEIIKRDPEISMELLAEQTGFDNVNYLFKVFKKLTGITPGSYRRLPEALA